MSTVPEGDVVVSRCATRLAEATLPDEAAFAADVTARYGAGGRTRRDLLRAVAASADGEALPARTGSRPAFVDLLASLDGAQAGLRVILADPLASDPVAVAGVLAAWRRSRGDRTHRFARPPGTDPGLAARIQGGAECLTLEQRRHGTPAATAVTRTEISIRVLAASPGEALAFLDAIGPRRRPWFRRR